MMGTRMLIALLAIAVAATAANEGGHFPPPFTQQYEKTIAALSSTLELQPSNWQARFLRGYVYDRLGAHDKAMADATEIIRQYPKRAEGYSLRAGIYNQKSSYRNAIADANRAIQIDPHNIAACTDAYLALGFAYLRLKNYHQAVLDLTAGLKLDPKDRNGLLHRAGAFVYLGKYKEAMADLQRADELDPKSTETLNHLAWMLATCPDSTVRNGTKATEYVIRLLRLAPDQWKFWDTRAAVFAENGDFGNALQWEKRCLERKDLSDAERARVNERLALYRAGKPCREQPK
jgi:Flp pilus assembly protein TadD